MIKMTLSEHVIHFFDMVLAAWLGGALSLMFSPHISPFVGMQIFFFSTILVGGLYFVVRIIFKSSTSEKNKEKSSNWFHRNETKIHIVASLVTIISVGVIAGTFIYEQFQLWGLREQNQKLLTESLEIEIAHNLQVIEGFEKQVDRISKTDEIFIPRFSTVIIEEAIKDTRFGTKEVTVPLSNGTVASIKIKVLLRDVYADMVIANEMLDLVDDMIMFGDGTFEEFIVAKARNFNTTKPAIKIIKTNLSLLEDYLQESYSK